MERRDITGQTLAERIDVSPTSISRILNGVSRPRQGTLSKLIAALCTTPDEQQLILSGYSGLPDAVDEESAIIDPNGNISAAELDRVARYLELKTLSIDFRESVARSLTDAGIVFESYARSGSVVTDFLITTPARTAIECKFNVNRDWEREACTAHILRTHLPCEHVIVVVPYLNNLATQFATLLLQVGARVVSITDLPHALVGKGAV
jgi:transcriptional regulator with XRE-family HTH domain